MHCPNCGVDNPDGAKFCTNCGKPLTLACPKCGTQNPAGAKFCFNCGQALGQTATVPAPKPAPSFDERLQRYMPAELRRKLESARSDRSMEGERRIVTILFCDVKGSTAMAETLDPEEWAEIMNRSFEFMIEPVYRYEGTIARLMGDAILAFFGAPVAHEDDPQRSILAALAIVEGMQPLREEFKRTRGIDFNVRVGINTGLVVVGEVGSDLRVEYTVMGDAANLASRMEQTAQPGTVQISAYTHRLVRPLFDFESLGPIEVKGKQEPVAAYRVLAAKAEPGSLRGIEGLNSPLIGRDQEFARLAALVDGLGGHQGHIVSVLGEAGLGKSRLLAEVRKDMQAHAAGRGERMPISWYEGRALSYQTATPYTLFISLLSDAFALSHEATDEANYAQIRTRITGLAPELVMETAPFIGAMMGYRLTGLDQERVRYLDPRLLRERIFMAVQTLVRQLAAQRPVVLVFDDLHWADATSLDLLEQLLPLTGTVALLIVALYRPQRQDASWRFHETTNRDYPHRHTVIELAPLDEAQSRELVAHLLHIEGLPESVRALILRKAEGNPFFVEEVVRSLLDAKLIVRENSHWRALREIADIAVPDTLSGVITARLDRLDDESKHAAQTAAVLGREFMYDVLEQVYDAPDALGGAVERLQQKELIRPRPQQAVDAYAFKHVLVQETAYGSLLVSRRRELHRRVADVLANVPSGAAGEIARHYLGAQEPTRALPYLIDAAERAARSYSTPEAITLYRQALAILETAVNLPLARRAYEGLGGALTLALDLNGALAIYDQMLSVARQHADIHMEISALNKLGAVRSLFMGQFAEGIRWLDDAERMSKETGDLRGLSEACTIRCQMATVAADFDTVLHYMGESVDLARKIGEKEELAHGLDHIAATLMYMTRYDEGMKLAEEGLALSREIGHREYEASFLGVPMALYHLREGHLDRATSSALEGAAIIDRTGQLFGQLLIYVMLGEIADLLGQYENALSYQQRAMQASEPMAQFLPFARAMALAPLGKTYFEIGGRFIVRAQELHATTLRILDTPMGVPAGADGWADAGFCALGVGGIDIAGELFHKGLTVPSIHMFLQKPRLLVGQALVLLKQGQHDEAARVVEKARAYSEARRMKHIYPLVALADGDISAARGDLDHALTQYRTAEALALEMGMRPYLWQSRAGAARVLAAQGQPAEAEAKRQGARMIIDEMASLFHDPVMAEAFVTSATQKLEAAR